MSKDYRVQDSEGNSINFTCANRRFHTDYKKEDSFSHGISPAKGSVFEQALSTDENTSMWLEYVSDDSGKEYFWFMFYDKEGKPIIPISSVFDRDELKEMMNRIIDLLN